MYLCSGSELQAEVENLALRLFYMESAKEDVRSDIAVMKRAAEKAETEVAKSETEKQKQVRWQKCLILGNKMSVSLLNQTGKKKKYCFPTES